MGALHYKEREDFLQYATQKQSNFNSILDYFVEGGTYVGLFGANGDYEIAAASRLYNSEIHVYVDKWAIPSRLEKLKDVCIRNNNNLKIYKNLPVEDCFSKLDTKFVFVNLDYFNAKTFFSKLPNISEKFSEFSKRSSQHKLLLRVIYYNRYYNDWENFMNFHNSLGKDLFELKGWEVPENRRYGGDKGPRPRYFTFLKKDK